MKCLMTFWTTTAAFRAEQALSGAVLNCQMKLVAVPIELAETCHGYGIEFDLPDADALDEPEKILLNAGVNWKAEWKIEIPYQRLMREKKEEKKG